MLSIPTFATELPGNILTSALWNNNVLNGFTYAYNPPIFYGYAATVQSIGNNSSVAVAIDTGVVDTYNGHSNTTNNTRYTAQVAGYYLLSGSVCYTGNTTGIRQAQVRVNGTAVRGSAQQTLSAGAAVGTTVGTVAVVAYLNVGDYAEIAAVQTSGAALSTSNTFTDQSTSMACLWVHA